MIADNAHNNKKKNELQETNATKKYQETFDSKNDNFDGNLQIVTTNNTHKTLSNYKTVNT